MVFVFFYEPSISLLLFRSCYDFALAMFVNFDFFALMSHLLRSPSFSCSVFASSPLCDNSIGTLGVRPTPERTQLGLNVAAAVQRSRAVAASEQAS